VKEELGLPTRATLTAELHSLLVYEPGQFFLPHQDSEKDDAMVGSLVVSLPSAHTGGELVIDHAGQSNAYRASKEELTFVAFYADCPHQVTPVRSVKYTSLVPFRASSAPPPWARIRRSPGWRRWIARSSGWKGLKELGSSSSPTSAGAAWTAQPLVLNSDAAGFVSTGETGGATPSSLSADGSSFSVTTSSGDQPSAPSGFYGGSPYGDGSPYGGGSPPVVVLIYG